MYSISIRTPSREGQALLPIWIDPGFMEAVAELQQIEAFQLVCYKGNQLVAILPLYEKKSMGWRRIICPMSAYYQGLWFFLQQGREANRNLLDELKISTEVAGFLKARYKKLELNLTPQNLDMRGFTWSGFKARPFYTFTHDLSQPLQLLKDERRKMRLAENKDYRLEEGFLPDVFIGLIKDLYDRKEKSLGVPYKRFQAWMENLHGRGLLTQFNLMKGADIVSTNLVLGGTDDRTGYSIMRSTRPEDLKSGASALHSMLLAGLLKERFTSLDFCGGNYPEVARFKAALGFRLELFFKISL
jgi:hypothetical protein